MSKTLKIGIGILSLGIIAALVAAGFVVRGAVAQAATPTPQNTGPMSKYYELFWQNLAGLLKVDENTLKADVVSAFGSTVDQAVKDGQITQSQGDQLKNNAQNNMNNGGFLPFFGGKHGWGGGFGFRGMKGGMGLNEFATAIGVTPQDLMTELQSGKTINQIATEHQKDPATVKADVLAALKTNLQSAVTAGKLTQTQADSIYQKYTNEIDTIMNSAGNMEPFEFHFRGGPNGAPNGTPNATPSAPSTNGSGWYGFWGNLTNQ